MKLHTLPLILCILLFSNISAQNKQIPGDTISLVKISFDDTTNLRYLNIPPTANNLWQIATTQKPGMAAYSYPGAIITDSINSYPPNMNSYFDIAIGEFNMTLYPMMIAVAFQHKFDTDTLRDGGFISVSWDNGLSFTNVALDSDYFFAFGQTPFQGWDPYGFLKNFYADTTLLFNGEPGFSGSSNGWLQTVLPWYIIPIKKSNPPDTMWLRFNFISDSTSSNKTGWVIDDILIYSIDLGGGNNDHLSPSRSALVFPNPASESANIRFDKHYNKVQLSIQSMDGRNVSNAEYFNVSNIECSLQGLAAGTYLLTFIFDDQRQESLRLQVSGINR